MGLGGGWSRISRLVSRRLLLGASCLSEEDIWLPSPHSPSQTLFLQTGAANLFTDSRISSVCRDSQAQGVTWEVPRKATS